MGRNTRGFLVGLVGVALTLLAYYQTIVTNTQCLMAGLVILVIGLLVKEGFLFPRLDD